MASPHAPRSFSAPSETCCESPAPGPTIYALHAAQAQRMLTIGSSGMDGGKLAVVADYTFVVPSFSIHRIQKTHVALLHIVWDLVHIALGEEDVI